MASPVDGLFLNRSLDGRRGDVSLSLTGQS
jgi:hypothetical protein